MIKIDLLGRAEGIDIVGRLILLAYGASIIAVILCCWIANAWVSGKLERLEGEVSDLETRLEVLKKTTDKVRDLEKKKKEIKNKLAVIATLKRSKIGPVRVLDDLSKAIPDKAWLIEIKESGGMFYLKGYALDNQTIATFMKELESSDYFQSVDLVEARQAVRQGVKIQLFTLQSKVNYAGNILKSLGNKKGGTVEKHNS